MSVPAVRLPDPAQSALTTGDCECERWRAGVFWYKESLSEGGSGPESCSNLHPHTCIFYEFISQGERQGEVRESLTGSDVSTGWNTRQINKIRLEMSCLPVEVTSQSAHSFNMMSPQESFRWTFELLIFTGKKKQRITRRLQNFTEISHTLL